MPHAGEQHAVKATCIHVILFFPQIMGVVVHWKATSACQCTRGRVQIAFSSAASGAGVLSDWIHLVGAVSPCINLEPESEHTFGRRIRRPGMRVGLRMHDLLLSYMLRTHKTHSNLKSIICCV